MDTEGYITSHTEVEIILQNTNSTTDTGLQEPITSIWSPVSPIEALPIVNNSTEEATVKIKKTAIYLQYIT